MKKIFLFVLLAAFYLSSCQLNKDALEGLKAKSDSLQAVIDSHVPVVCDTTVVDSVTVVHRVTKTTYDTVSVPVQDTTFVSDTNWVNLWIEIPDTVVVTVYDTVDVPRQHKCIFKNKK